MNTLTGSLPKSRLTASPYRIIHSVCLVSGRLMCVYKKKKHRSEVQSPQKPTPSSQQQPAGSAMKKAETSSQVAPLNMAQNSARRDPREPRKIPAQKSKMAQVRSASVVARMSEKKNSSPSSAILVPHEVARSTVTATAPEGVLVIDPPKEMKAKRNIDAKRDPQDPEYKTLQIERGEWESAKIVSRLELKKNTETASIKSEECR